MTMIDENDFNERLLEKSLWLTAEGAEIPDPTPIALPVGYVPPPPLHVQLARFQDAAERYAEYFDEEGNPVFEDEDPSDFDVDDDEPLSVHEEAFHFAVRPKSSRHRKNQLEDSPAPGGSTTTEGDGESSSSEDAPPNAGGEDDSLADS